MNKNKLIIIRLTISLVIFIPLFILHFFIDINLYVLLPLTILSYLVIGYDILYKSVRNIFKGQLLDENFLMSIATIGAFFIGEYLEAVAVMVFYQIGEYFQEYAVEKSRKAIKGLMDIKSDTTTLIKDGNIEIIEPEDIVEGDLILVKPGEKVPVDGVILKGNSSLDMKALTGESIPKDVFVGDEILSGSLNISSSIEIQATKDYYDSTVAKILDMVENATGMKAKSEAFITKFARIYTPVVVLFALLLGLVPPIFLGNFNDWIFRALTFLVVSCPCALVISVPLSFYCGIGGASKYGVLVKGGSYLEMLNKANIFVFDKTGTITKAQFKVVEVRGEETLNIAAILESKSSHPIAQCIVKKANLSQNIDISVTEIPGFGITAELDELVLVGNSKLMEKYNIDYVYHDGIGSVVYVAKGNKFIGSILVADTLKDEAKDTICKLNSFGYKTIMLTGDKENAAIEIAKEVGIEVVKAELLPNQKVEALQSIISNKEKNDIIAYVGDGINDAPALMLADVGISMGSIGSDSAIEASDVVLMYDKLDDIVTAKKVAKKTINIVMQNIIFALTVKIGILILSAFGFANMWFAIIGDVGVAVLAILNAMRCSKIK